MKTTAINPNAISTIAHFGETVYNENGKAVFVKSSSNIDLDNDDEVQGHINALQGFSDALASLGYSIEKEIKEDHFLTNMLFETYSYFAGLNQEEINNINIVSAKIDEMVDNYNEATDRSIELLKKINEGASEEDTVDEAVAVNKLRGLVYLTWMWTSKFQKALVGVDSYRFCQWEWLAKNFIKPNQKVLKHIVKRYQLSVN